MRLNITAMRDTLMCPQYGYNKHIVRRGPVWTPVALDVGSLFHEGMEQRLVGEPVIKHLLPSWGMVSQPARDTFDKHKLWIPMNAFAPDPNWEIHGIEMRVGRAITPNLELVGRLDGFILWQGKLWDLQWKTYSDDLLDLIEKVRLSWHEVGYQWMAESTAPSIPWGGTILGACQKLPGYRMTPDETGKKTREEVTDRMREAAFTLHFITRSPEKQEEMVRQLIQTAMKVQSELEAGAPLRNYDSCFGKFGTKCAFYDVCHHHGHLHGPEFIDLEDRYGDEENNPAPAA